MDDAQDVYLFRRPPGGIRLPVDSTARPMLVRWLREWRSAETETIGGITLTRTPRWEGRSTAASTVIRIQAGTDSFDITPDVADKWAADLEAAELGVYEALPPEQE